MDENHFKVPWYSKWKSERYIHIYIIYIFMCILCIGIVYTCIYIYIYVCVYIYTCMTICPYLNVPAWSPSTEAASGEPIVLHNCRSRIPDIAMVSYTARKYTQKGIANHVGLPMYLSIYLSIYLPIYVSIYLSTTHLSIYLPTYLRIYLYTRIYQQPPTPHQGTPDTINSKPKGP